MNAEEFNKHQEKIAEIIMGCRGVISREVHWREVVPILAAYVIREIEKSKTLK